MTGAVFKAWFAGAGILVFAYVTWFAFLQVGTYSELFVFLLWSSPFIAALVSSYLGPSKKIILGASMAVTSAILAVIFNTAYQLLGNAVDFPNFQGGLILFATTLIHSGIVAGLGSVVGYFLARQRESKVQHRKFGR